MKRFILKTNIKTSNQIKRLSRVLKQQSNITTWSVDMHDIDRVLVVNTNYNFEQNELIDLVKTQGIHCEDLAD